MTGTIAQKQSTPATVVAVQPQIILPYPNSATFDASAMDANLAASVTHIKRAKDTWGASLVAFPEFFLTGYTLGVDVFGWIKASITIPGRETDVLAKAAVDAGVYVAACVYERMDQFPGRFFNTAFIINPDGDIILTYRKLYAMTSKTRPTDVLDEWLDIFGFDSLFPVADTPIGRIGAMIARDANWPEMARSLALRGAEIFYNPNAAQTEPNDAGLFVRRSRAYENHCYLISPNIGPLVANGDMEGNPGRAPTEIIDYQGNIISMAQGGAEMTVVGQLDIEGLRAFRNGGNPKGNALAQLQPQLHAPLYSEARLFPSNGWKDKPLQFADENKAVERGVLAQLITSGVLVAPQDS